MKLYFLLVLLITVGCQTSNSPSTSDVRVFNGVKAGADELKHVLDIGTCTGSFIGPHTILTAAHCTNTLNKPGFKLGKITYKWTCYKHPRYNSKTLLNDYALCITKVKAPSSIPLASVDVRTPVAIGEEVLLAGYGRPNSGELYYGATTLDEYRGQDLILDSQVHLGSGDSGGSAFRLGTLDVIGIQSRTFVSSRRSILNRTYDGEFRWFLADIALKHRLSICGFTRKC